MKSPAWATLVVAALLLCNAPGMAAAWGPIGHQAVGAIADKYIAGTNAATQVHKILGGMKLQQAALWADCAKGVTRDATTHEFEYHVDKRFAECKPFESAEGRKEMVEFVRANWDACEPQAGEEVCHKQYHYADVALERNMYQGGIVGTSDHDVVGAINAAVAVLQGRPAPAPFTFAGKREALMALAHYVGDIHQPLHVVAVYLDPDGEEVDPDAGIFNPATKTEGGNKIQDGARHLHTEWDSIPASLGPGHVPAGRMAAARKVPVSPSPVSSWATEWATDTVVIGKGAFKGLTFGHETASQQWPVMLPAKYEAKRSSMQGRQIVKAGAHLGQLLEAIWP